MREAELNKVYTDHVQIGFSECPSESDAELEPPIGS